LDGYFFYIFFNSIQSLIFPYLLPIHLALPPFVWAIFLYYRLKANHQSLVGLECMGLTVFNWCLSIFRFASRNFGYGEIIVSHPINSRSIIKPLSPSSSSSSFSSSTLFSSPSSGISSSPSSSLLSNSTIMDKDIKPLISDSIRVPVNLHNVSTRKLNFDPIAPAL